MSKDINTNTTTYLNKLNLSGLHFSIKNVTDFHCRKLKEHKSKKDSCVAQSLSIIVMFGKQNNNG